MILRRFLVEFGYFKVTKPLRQCTLLISKIPERVWYLLIDLGWMKRRMKRVGHKKHGNTCWKNMLSEHSGSCQFPNIKIFHGGIFASVIIQKYLKRLVAINIQFNRWRKTW